MPILVKCGGCQAKMNAPDTAAGKKVKCPKCGEGVAVPAAGGSAAVATATAPAPAKRPAAPKPEPEAKQPAPAAKQSNDDIAAVLPDHQAERVTDELQEKERLLWVGKPSVKLMVIRSLPFLFVPVVLLGVSIFMFPMANDPNGLPILVPIGMIVVAACMFTAPFFAKGRANRTFYALTNKRALVWMGGLFAGASLKEYGAMRLGNMKMQRSWVVAGAGDLVFEEETRITTTHHAGGYSGGHYRGGRHYGGHYTPGHTTQTVQIIQKGFMAIPEVAEVERLIKKEIIAKLQRALDEE